MRALITGATGFLGGHLTRALLDRGHLVVELVRDWRSACEFHEGPSTASRIEVRGDLSDVSLIERVLSEYEVETVFHLAAQTQFSTALQDPVGTFETNVRGTWNVLDACRRQGVRRVIVASSDKAHGRAAAPYTEETQLLPDRPYEASKACADILARTYASSYDMSVAVTRFVNLYGPRHLNWSTLIPGTIRRLLRGESPVVRNGGLMRRDWLFVEDAVDGYLRLAESDHRGAMNFGTGHATSVMDVVRLLMSLMRSDVAIVDEGDKRGEISDQWSHFSLAKTVLGWSPKHSLSDGLRKTIDWYRGYLSKSQH